MTSPLMISIALHYYCRAGDFGKGIGDNNFDAPAVRDAIGDMRSAGLLAASPAGCEAQYFATEGLKVYVEALKSVPFPLQQWAIPASERTP
jgi:hypothetical protein